MTQVVIDDIIPRTQLVAAADQTVFNTNWTADVATDIDVYARAEDVPSDDITQLVSPSLYNVTFVGGSQTVRVTFLTGRALNDVITIVRNTPAERLNLYTNTNFVPSMLNQDFGILTLVDQQAQMYDKVINPGYYVSATIETDSILGGGDKILPILPAKHSWRKNSDNTGIETISIPDGGLSPAIATYVLNTPNEELTNSQSLSLLESGMAFVTTSTGIVGTRILQGATNELDITDGDGIGGNPTYKISDNVILPGTSGMGLIRGSTAQRPVTPGANTFFRFNSDTESLEYWNNTDWIKISEVNGVITITETANEIDVDSTDPENPVISLSSTLNTPGTFTIQGSTAVDAIINENTMATASATNLATALSIKTYVDGLNATSVKSVSGTLNRVTSTGGVNPIIDISSAYVGQASITTLGTVTTGTWNATPIDLATYVSGNLSVSHLNSGTSATSTTFWRGDGTWAIPAYPVPGGNNKSIQYNNAGVLGGDNDFTTNGLGGITISTSLSVSDIRITGSTISSISTNSNILIVPSGAGRVGILTSTPRATLDVGGTNMISGSTVDPSNKFWSQRIGNYSSSIGEFNYISASSFIAQNIVDIGGGTTSWNAATNVNIRAAIDNNTLSGTIIADFTSSGMRLGTANSRVTTIINDNTMATATATNLSTSSAIKDYVDSKNLNPGGANKSIQYNNAGAFAGDTGFSTTGSGALTVSTSLAVANLSLNGNNISSTNTDGHINILPNGQGNISVGGVGTSLLFPLSPTRSISQFATGGKRWTGIYASYLNDTSSSSFILYKSRSTVVGTSVAVNPGDSLGQIIFYGDGAGVPNGSSIACNVSGPVSTGIVPTELVINTSNSSGATVPAITISNAQEVTFANQINASSINFGGSSLGNYVEGTFTPVLRFGGASVGITYSAQTGKYTRVGNMVTFFIAVGLTSKGSSTGLSDIVGLPIAQANLCLYTITQQSTTYTGQLIAVAIPATGTINISNVVSGGTLNNLSDTNFTNTSLIIINGNYFI